MLYKDIGSAEIGVPNVVFRVNVVPDPPVSNLGHPLRLVVVQPGISVEKLDA
jgi:hypothetical protein